jgi:hypothetical protein
MPRLWSGSTLAFSNLHWPEIYQAVVAFQMGQDYFRASAG